MTKETVTIDGKPAEMETRRITLLCHKGDVNVKFPNRIELSPEATVHHARKVKKLHARTRELFTPFFPKPVMTLGYWHVLGLIDLTLKLHDMKVPVAWIMPETYLHPSQQCLLADLAVKVTAEEPDAGRNHQGG